MTSNIFCRIQFNDAEKLKLPVLFIDPQWIYQPNMVMKLRTDTPKIKGKSKKEKIRVVKEITKSHNLTISTYIERAMLEMLDKDYIMASYNFKLVWYVN